MEITKDTKQNLISKFANNENDTGSTEVQIAILSERIKNLTEHFKEHKHDNHSKYGLIAMVNKRKKLLKYLSNKDNQKHEAIRKELNIR
jgi:small subunit ribosomal protein S15